MRNDRRGSIWRKWDFPFQTQSSFDHDYKSGTDDNLIKTLLDAEVAAVVVSDHHKIDVQRIRNLQSLAANRLVIFPGVELRSELGGGESVHFIGIFPEDSDLEDLWDNLKVKLAISAKQVRLSLQHRSQTQLHRRRYIFQHRPTSALVVRTKTELKRRAARTVRS